MPSRSTAATLEGASRRRRSHATHCCDRKAAPRSGRGGGEADELGPPFDPSVHEIERHTVFLGPDVAVFSFEGGQVPSLLASLGGDDEQSVLAVWEPLLDGTPLIASEAYHWVNPDRSLQEI